MANVYNKPSFDKHADNLLQTIEKEWNQDVKHDELVLTFTVGAKRERGLPPSLLPLLEVTPTSSENAGGKSFLDPKPCSYLDCSGIKFGSSTDSTFASLVILDKYLEKVKYVKVLIFVPYNKLMTPADSDTQSNWSSTIFSCPAIHLLNEMSHLKMSFGLVVVQHVESKPSRKNFQELRNAFIGQIQVIRNNLFTEDPSPELKLYLTFLKLIIRRDINFLILQQEQKYHWDGTVKSLVNLKSPPGNKIVKFHQQYLRVSNKISGKDFLSTLKKVHDGQHFTGISSRLHNQSIYLINQLIASTLNSVLKQYSFEATCLPKQQSYAKLVERLRDAIEFTISSSSYEEFMELISILAYPLDIDLQEKLSTYFMQLKSITEVSNVLDIDIEQLKYQVNLKKECKIFHDKLKKKLFPKLAADLQTERQEICTILQSAYQAISQSLIDFYQNKILPQNLVQAKSRQHAIEMLCKAEELLEILEPETSSSLQMTVYQNLCNWPGYELILTDFLRDVVHELENQHKSVEQALQLAEHQYISCGNHSASSISKKLRDHVNEVKCNMITCSEVVQEIEKELDAFFNHVIVTFEKEQICTGLDMESLPEKLNKINPFLESLEERQNGIRLLTCGTLLIELEYISELFLNRNLGLLQKAEIGKGLGNLETFLESIQRENVRADILKDLFTTSMRTILMERLTGLKKMFTILMNMKESLSSYNSQSNPETFTDNASLSEGLLLSIIGDGQNSPSSLHDIKLKGKHMPTKFPAIYLSLAKEIVRFSHQEVTKVELISNNVLQIKGNFVKFSDFVHNDVAICKSDLKEIHVFATKRIFVDKDFNDGLGRELEITLISPSIDIIGRRLIHLNGNPGINNFYSYLATGLGHDGRTGLPGKAGGNGGHLYLICEEIVNSEMLTVNVQGGDGGDGQDGGNGCGGAPGRNAQASELSDQQTVREGEPGSSGGNGGDGGVGGYPGHGGSVEVVVLEKQDGIVQVFTEDGERGSDGKGGNGGLGGKSGDGIERVKGWIWFVKDDKKVTSNTRAPHGKPGRDGANSTNQVLPPPRKSKPDSKATVISELRKFYINQSNYGTRQFLEKIDLKLEFEHVTVKTLTEDLLQLELTSTNLYDPDSMIRDHEVFQNRLHRSVPHLIISSEQLPGKDDIEHVIRLLYAQSISKVHVLKEHQGQHGGATGAQVINILGYFDIIKDTINRLKESNVEVNRREALKTYHDHLKAKCDDTQEFISRTVLPSIAQAKREIQEEMNCCAGEVESYGRMVEVDLRRRCDAAALASSTIQFWEITKTVITVLETGIKIAQRINYSPFAAMALSGIAGFKSLLGIDDDNTPENRQQPSIQLPACLHDFHGTMEDKMTRMRKEWELVNRFVEAHGNDCDNHVRSKIIKIRPSLEAWQAQLTHFQLSLNLMRLKNVALGEELENAITKMEKNKAEILNFLHEMLEGKSTNDIELSSELIENIKHLLVEMALTNCNSTLQKFPTKRPPPTEPIPIAQSQLQSVQQKKAAIFQNIVPLINAVFGTVQDNIVPDKNGSSASRKFDKLRIQITLRKLKENLANFFNGLESKKNLMQAVQQMEEGLSLLIDLYDMMDSYEESKLFSSALAGIKINSNDQDSVELQETVDKIGYLLKANTFVLDYNQAVHAFKQWIFPFANRCPIPSLNFEMDLTNGFVNLENHLEKLAAEYKAHFDTIHGHLLRYRSTKMDFDDVVFRGMFSSRSSACPSFYAWTFEEWGNTIQRFLRGEEVELRADLMKAEELIKRKMGAVKFKTVKLKIRPRHGIMSRKQEEELNKIMKDFKVTMVHSGISYYKVFDQCFVMRGSKNEYCYSFDGATKNSTYEKSESQGDYLLSPFTIWKFRLNEILGGAGGFERLNKFEGQVDLELWGDGLYLDEGKAKGKKLDEKYLKDLHLHYELVQG